MRSVGVRECGVRGGVGSVARGSVGRGEVWGEGSVARGSVGRGEVWGEGECG